MNFRDKLHKAGFSSGKDKGDGGQGSREQYQPDRNQVSRQSSDYRQNGQNQSDRNQVSRGQSQSQPQPSEIKPEHVPDNYADAAEKCITKLKQLRCKITTTKIRNILSLVSDIYNSEILSRKDELSDKSKAAVQKMRVRIAYECGRNRDIKNFITETRILNYIKGLAPAYKRIEFIRFAEYMEALVAYHRFYGGAD